MYSEKLIVVRRAASHEPTDPSVVQNPHAAQRLKLALAQRIFATTDFHRLVRLFIKHLPFYYNILCELTLRAYMLSMSSLFVFSQWFYICVPIRVPCRWL